MQCFHLLQPASTEPVERQVVQTLAHDPRFKEFLTEIIRGLFDKITLQMHAMQGLLCGVSLKFLTG